MKLHHISTQPDVDGASCDISNPNVLGCNKGKYSTQSQSAVAKNCTGKKRNKTLVISILLVCYHSSVLETGKTRQSRNVNSLFLVDNVHCMRVGGLLCTADILTKNLVLTCNKCYVLSILTASTALLYSLPRSIKRKKFDDELVESSLVKSSSRMKGPPVVEPVRCSGSEPSSSEKKKVLKTTKITHRWIGSWQITSTNRLCAF